MPTNRTRIEASGNGLSPMIKCSSCGAEIMLVSDVKLMSKAIETHIEIHKSRIKNPKLAEAEAESIRDDLIKQVFDKAAEAEQWP